MKHASKSWYRVTAHLVGSGQTATWEHVWTGEAFSPEHALYLAGRAVDADSYPLTVEVEDWQNPEAES